MTNTSKYSSAWVAAAYDSVGEREWDRFSRTPADRVNLFIHEQYLRRFVPPGSRVLEVGPGPGRFTQILADMGCRIFVTDISPGQLDAHRKYAANLNFDSAVEERRCLDVCDLRGLNADSFDAVVCYGGPLSYVFDQALAGSDE